MVTTSWDDGHPLDLRLAELLSRYGIAGTFYVPLDGFRGGPRLRASELRGLHAAGFEIGAHGVTHQRLDTMPAARAACELRESKDRLQQLIAAPVSTFCYPNGRYTRTLLRDVRDAGYLGARTTRMLHTGVRDPFRMPTTVQAYPHAFDTYLRNALRGGNLSGLLGSVPRLLTAGDWVELSMRSFQAVLHEGGVWHLYGHSWELEELSLWRRLENVLEFVAHRSNVRYLTNGAALQGCARPSTKPAPAAA